MSDQDSKSILDATAGLIRSVEGLVRAVTPAIAPPADAPPAVAPRELVEVKPSGSLDRSDSPAWLDHHIADAKPRIRALADSYFDANVPASSDPASKHPRDWDPSKGATWKDLARIYRNLFDPSEVFETVTDANGQKSATGALNERPFFWISLLQKILHLYDVNDPDAVIGDRALPWPDLHAVPEFPAKPGGNTTVRAAVSLYLSFFNRDGKGAAVNRADDLRKPDGKRDEHFVTTPPAGTFTLSHGQCVELYHVFVAQHDVRLLAPYDVLDTEIW